MLPLALSVYIGFTPMKNWNVHRYMGEVVGLRNYERLFHMISHDPDMKAVAVTTVVFVAITLAVNVLGGLGLALATYFMEESVAAGYQLLWLLARMTPVAVYSLLWYYFFHGTELGVLNALLLRLGVVDEPVSLGRSPEYLPWGTWLILVAVNGFVGVSFGMVVFYSALRSIPRELVIAARVDGARVLELVRYVLIPGIRWHIIFVTVWQLLSLLTTFAHIFLLVEWRVVHGTWGQTWALYVFRTAFTVIKDQGLAAAAAAILSVIGIALGLISLRVLGYSRMITQPRGEL